jgi:hypothetical protein
MTTGHELIPINIVDAEQAFPSPSQRRELLSIARIEYLRKNKISITNMDTLKTVMGVLEDARVRQLREEGRETSWSNEKLKPLIEKGLLLRESLCGEAKDILDLTLINETVGLSNMGPLALQNSLLAEAGNELKNHLLTPNLKAIERLVTTSRGRKLAIDKIAAVGLAHLPEGLENITLDRIPNIADRAKLIRNMISSFLFRGNLNPIIDIADLRNFQTLNRPEYFSDEMGKKIVVALNLSDKEEVVFILDLLNQTKEVFPNIQFASEDDVEGMDRLFRKASKSLLLLHPILEGEQISIFPSTVVSGVPSLWDDAEIVAGSKIPSRKKLYQAIGQTKAKNDNFNTRRLYDGISVLNKHDRIALIHAAKAEKLKERLSERKILLENLASDPTYPLPAEAYSEKYSSEKRVCDKRSIVDKFDQEIRKMTKVIENNLEIQKEAREYEKWLKITYGDILPGFVPMPRSVFLQKLQREAGSLRASRVSKNTLLIKIEEALSVDLLFSGKDGNIFGYLSKEGAREWINRELARSRMLAEGFEEKPESIPYKNPDHIKFPNGMVLRDYEKRLAGNASPAALRSYVQFWKDKSLNLKRHANSKPEIWKKHYAEFALEAIRQRINLLEYSLGITEKFFSLANDSEDAKTKLRMFLDNPKEPLSANAVWSKDDARAYVWDIKISELPITEGMKYDDLRKTVLRARKFLAFVSPSIFPLVVSGRSELDAFMKNEVIETKKKLNEKMEERESLLKESLRISKEGRRGRRAMTKKVVGQIWEINRGINSLNEQLKFSFKAAGLVSNPFAPFFLNRTLKRDDFLRIWRKRISLASTILNREKIREKSKLAKIAFEALLRDAYASKVTREIESMQDNLEVLEKEDLGSRLIEKMSKLNLALKDPSQREESLLKDQNAAEREKNSQ